MADIENGSAPNERGSTGLPADPAAAETGAPQKVCKDCGISVKGHWRYKHKGGYYYCRSCFRRHAARRRLQRRLRLGLRRRTILFLLFLAACLLVVVACFLADEIRRGLFRGPRY